ncbi:hypothetical protein [Lacrimispora sp.]
MLKQEMISTLISQIPEDKLDSVLDFIRFVLYENAEASSALLSESLLAKD